MHCWFPRILQTYGFYCLSHYAGYTIPEWFNINENRTMLYNFTEDSICAFYCGWVVLSFGLVLASARTNLLYVLQCLTAFASLATKRHAAGILQAISGFLSLLICFSQILNNETFGRLVFPTCPCDPYNEIDYPYQPTMAPPVVPVGTAPVVPVPTTPVVPVV